MATVSTIYIKDILKTLPVGYYLGSRAEVEFSETAETSVCNPMTGQIIVSAKNVTEALKNLPDNADTEEFVRDALYHEVSHLILTPKISCCGKYLNIFEDERIECLLAKFYKKVNFKRFCLEMNHWTPDMEIKDEIQFFFNIVRFRNGPSQFVDRVPELIEKWHEINCTTQPYDTKSEWFKQKYCNGDEYIYGTQSFGSSPYVDEILSFFSEVSRYWKNMTDDEKKQAGNQKQNKQETGQSQKSNTDEKSQNAPGQSSEENSDNQGNNGNEVVDGKTCNDDKMEDGDNSVKTQIDQSDNSENENCSADENFSDEDSETTDGQDQQDNGMASEDAVGGKDQTTPLDEAIEEAEKKAEINAIDPTELESKVKDIINNALTVYSDPAICSNVRRIMIRACKKRANRAAVLNKYVGKIDPRSVGIRKDYKWFQQKGENGSNKFDRVHLVLWVDKSGSFSSAIPMINKLIKSLNDVEKMMPYDFSFDVVAMNTKNVLHDKTIPLIAQGGNLFGPDVEDLSRKLNRPGWSNYNVVVWDGDLGSFRRNEDYECSAISSYVKKYRRAFNVFNNQHSIIVSDTSNTKYLNRPCKNARMKFINYNYANTFVSTVIELLDHML